MLVILQFEDRLMEILKIYLDIISVYIEEVSLGILIYSKNNIKYIKTHYFPTILYFNKSDKLQPLIYKEKFDYFTLTKFISKNS